MKHFSKLIVVMGMLVAATIANAQVQSDSASTIAIVPTPTFDAHFDLSAPGFEGVTLPNFAIDPQNATPANSPMIAAPASPTSIPVPEPTTFALIGLSVLGMLRRPKRETSSEPMIRPFDA